MIRSILRSASLVLALSAGINAPAHAEEYLKSYSVDGRADVHINAQWGIVHVTSSPGNKVEFDVTYDKKDWASSLSIDSKQQGNVVSLTALVDEHSWWGWSTFSDRRVTIEVRMPMNADLQLQTSNGGVNVSSVSGHVSIHTTNGEINAEQLTGTIDIGSTNGKVILGTLSGAVKVHTTNGAIRADHLVCRCALETTNGQVDVAGRFESLDVTSANGGIVARAESGSRMSIDWRVRTTNARVDLSVPADFKANLNASTVNGRITSDLPITVQGDRDRQELRGTLNGGGPEMNIRTTNGAIRVSGI
jgi:Putative adhesin